MTLHVDADFVLRRASVHRVNLGSTSANLNETKDAAHKVLVRPEVLVVTERSSDVLELLLIVADSREEDDCHDVVRLEARPSSKEFGEEAVLRTTQREESKVSKEDDLSR